MAVWAADCAERVLPLFEAAHPGDGRPHRAIEACRAWVETGVFRMVDIRGASLAAHAAARTASRTSVARAPTVASLALRVLAPVSRSANARAGAVPG